MQCSGVLPAAAPPSPPANAEVDGSGFGAAFFMALTGFAGLAAGAGCGRSVRPPGWWPIPAYAETATTAPALGASSGPDVSGTNGTQSILFGMQNWKFFPYLACRIGYVALIRHASSAPGLPGVSETNGTRFVLFGMQNNRALGPNLACLWVPCPSLTPRSDPHNRMSSPVTCIRAPHAYIGLLHPLTGVIMEYIPSGAPATPSGVDTNGMDTAFLPWTLPFCHGHCLSGMDMGTALSRAQSAERAGWKMWSRPGRRRGVG
jgi:hypothetical protein